MDMSADASHSEGTLLPSLNCVSELTFNDLSQVPHMAVQSMRLDGW